jgi:hypothetical protein
MWVLGGRTIGYRSNDVWSSANGNTWAVEKADLDDSVRNSWSQREGHTSLVFKGRMWVLGGQGRNNRLNDVWSSTNGAFWTRVKPDNTSYWSRRSEHTSLVFNNKMWVIGGYDGSRRLNDVWSSTNGSTWTRLTSSANWPAREGHTSLVFDNKMWVLGGTPSSSNRNDVWFSVDGRTWTLGKDNVNDNNNWSRRQQHTSLVFDGRMWVLGGWDGSHEDDAWSFAFENDEFESALQLSYEEGINATVAEHAARITSSLQEDYYRIMLPAGNYTFSSQGSRFNSSGTRIASLSTRCALYSDDNTVTPIANASATNCSITRTLSADEYYIRVRYSNALGNYTLRIRRNR